MTAYLKKDETKALVKVFDSPEAGAERIVTEYRVLKRERGYTLTEVVLHTGKTHQIRAHLSHIGCPVAGDTKYGFAEEDLVLIDKKDPAKHTTEIKAKMPKGFDIVVDATGAPSITEATFNFVHMGSKIVVYGVCPAEATIQVNPYKIFSQEYTIIGSFAQTHCFPRALAYLESGVVQVDELISHELPLEEYGTGLDLIVGKKAKKVIIHP